MELKEIKKVLMKAKYIVPLTQKTRRSYSSTDALLQLNIRCYYILDCFSAMTSNPKNCTFDFYNKCPELNKIFLNPQIDNCTCNDYKYRYKNKDIILSEKGFPTDWLFRDFEIETSFS